MTEPEDGQAVEEWDGHPRYALTASEMQTLYSYAPQWHGAVEGPPIPFVGQRALVLVNSIFRATREEAEEALWVNVRETCKHEGMEFREDEWRITHCVLIGGS